MSATKSKSLKLPKGLFAKGNIIWYSYYNRIFGKTMKESTGLQLCRENIAEAKIIREEKINESRKGVRAEDIEYGDILNVRKGLDLYYLERTEINNRTKEIYKLAVDGLVAFTGLQPICKITSQHFEDFFNEIGNRLSPNTIAIYSRQLKALFSFFVKKNWITHNPVPLKPTYKKEIKAIPENVLSEILDYLYKTNIHAYELIYTLYLTGMRISEALVLRWKDVNFDYKIITVPDVKLARFHNKRFTQVPLLEQLEPVLLNLQKRCPPKSLDDFVFNYTDRRCSFFDRAQVRIKEIKYAKTLIANGMDQKTANKKAKAQKFKADYNKHQLRKTYITVLSRLPQINTIALQTLARHENIDTTTGHYIERVIHDLGLIASKEANFIKPQITNKTIEENNGSSSRS